MADWSLPAAVTPDAVHDLASLTEHITLFADISLVEGITEWLRGAALRCGFITLLPNDEQQRAYIETCKSRLLYLCHCMFLIYYIGRSTSSPSVIPPNIVEVLEDTQGKDKLLLPGLYRTARQALVALSRTSHHNLQMSMSLMCMQQLTVVFILRCRPQET
jgi:hypothetical protein